MYNTIHLLLHLNMYLEIRKFHIWGGMVLFRWNGVSYENDCKEESMGSNYSLLKREEILEEKSK